MGDRVGQLLGNYRLLRLLGRGGSASVYLGEHLYLKSHAALKVLHTVVHDEDAERFVKEAQILVRLAHPHIVRVLDFAVEAGMPFLVMEYAPHGTLRSRHPKGAQVPLPTIVSYVKPLASALQYAHDQRLIHRDVKPENILLGAQAELLLSDFGLAWFAPHTHSLGTQMMDQSIAGTAPYLAPEQLQGKPGTASDQYALGVVVYEWLCGRPPFRGSAIEITLQHLSIPPAPLREQVPDLSRALEQVVLRALAKEPKDRFARVQEFASALEQASQEAVPHPSPLPTPKAKEPRPRGGQPHVAGSIRHPQPIWKVPAVFASLLGRSQEVTAICALLTQPDVRLLTLLGTGGIGKTRLAVQIAREMRADFADGVCFVPLAAISDPDFVLPAIAQALGLHETAAREVAEELHVALGEHSLLLLLDNFEQVLSAAPQLWDLLAACPNLHLLVTSRAPLRLHGEHEFALSPLPLPDLNHLPTRDMLAQYASCTLFVQRAQAITPDFQLTQANARTIAEICIRLDGLPLAIELAAARTRLLSPQALLARLTHRLDVLTGGARNLPARQQTLRSTIAWSYHLLLPAEQQIFRTLSVFADGCTLQAVEAIAQAAGHGASTTLDGVSVLLENNLVRQMEQPDGEPRLLLLETIREYGLECLADTGEWEAAHASHAAYYLALAEEAEPHLLGGPEQVRWNAQLERDQENLRAALTFLLERARVQARTPQGQVAASQALRLCAALYRFWYDRGYVREGQASLSQALARSEGVAAPLRARALYAAAELAAALDDMERIETLGGECLSLYQELGDTAGVASCLSLLGTMARVKGHYALACSRLQEAQGLFQQLGNRWKQGRCHVELARTATEQGQYEWARTLLEDNLKVCQVSGDQVSIGWVRYLLARLLFVSQQDLARGESLALQSLGFFQELGYAWHRAYPLGLLGQMRLAQGEVALAREWLEESLALVQEGGDREGALEPLLGLARVAEAQGDREASRRRYQECLTLLQEIRSQAFLATCLEGLAALEAAQGASRRAAQLWGAAEMLREAMGAPIYPVHRTRDAQAIAHARAILGEQAFHTAWAEGRSLTPEQVLATPHPTPGPAPVPPSPPPAAPAKKPVTFPAGLTAREVEVLRLLAQGWTDVQIAEHLVISPRTVNHHTTSLYSKLNVPSRAAATRYALEHHLL